MMDVGEVYSSEKAPFEGHFSLLFTERKNLSVAGCRPEPSK